MVSTPRQLAHAALVLVLVALVAAGCGSSRLGKGGYESKVDGIGTKSEGQLHGVVDGNSPPTAKQMRTAGTVFQQASKDLGDIDPPGKVTKAHGELVDGYGLLGDAFARYADKLASASTDADRAQVFVDFAADAKVQKAFDDLTAAQAAFRKAGYSKVLGPDDGGATARSGTATTKTSTSTTATSSTKTTPTKTTTPPPAT